ncbi:MAG: hypothetical protein H0W66_04765 [Chthoniobacterales bacterium]|nr:hypothetical protein [Chthoniobacterales bacterium]
MKLQDEFERFQERIGGLRESHPLLWLLRDSIYLALHYQSATDVPLRRHQWGLWGWRLRWWRDWLFFRPLPNSPPNESTRFGFLFYGSWDSHFATLLPVLSELAAREPVSVWTLALNSRQLQDLEAMSNVRLLPIAGSLSYDRPRPSDRRRALADYRVLAQSEKLTTEEHLLLRTKASRVVELIFDYLNWTRIWNRAKTQLPTEALLLTSESTPLVKAMRDLARSQGCRVVHFFHGLPGATHQVTSATDVCVFSALEKDWLETRAPPGTRVHAIGNPRMEEIRKRVGPPRRRAKDEPFRALFFSQGPGSDYTPAMRRQDLGILARDQGSWHLRVRPHPTESEKLLREDLALAGLEVNEISSQSLLDDLTWSDVALTSFSTALLEAAVCGRICYWVNAQDYSIAAAQALRAQGIGGLIKSSEEWNSAIKRLLTLEMSEPEVVRKEVLLKLRIINPSGISWAQRLDL